MSKKVYALLTGRGNNTLPNKNIRDILGKPTLYYAANAAKKVSLIDDFFCSSDDEKILCEAEKLGYKKINRPLELALPTSQHVDAIIHALNEMKKECETPDLLVVMLANNVTVKAKWIEDCLNIANQSDDITSVVPVYVENDHHPYRAKSLDKNGDLQMFVPLENEISTNRQDLPDCYFLAHNFWVLNVKNLLSNSKGQQPWAFMGDKIKPYIINESIDIHEEKDFLLAKLWIEEEYDSL